MDGLLFLFRNLTEDSAMVSGNRFDEGKGKRRKMGCATVVDAPGGLAALHPNTVITWLLRGHVSLFFVLCFALPSSSA